MIVKKGLQSLFKKESAKIKSRVLLSIFAIFKTSLGLE
jgi:hypothetical protein